MDTITLALAQMAAFRCADVSEQTIELFARRLMAEQCQVVDVVKACAVLEQQERAEGETSFPSLGTLNKHIRAQQSVRRQLEREADAAEVARLAMVRAHRFLESRHE